MPHDDGLVFNTANVSASVIRDAKAGNPAGPVGRQWRHNQQPTQVTSSVASGQRLGTAKRPGRWSAGGARTRRGPTGSDCRGCSRWCRRPGRRRPPSRAPRPPAVAAAAGPAQPAVPAVAPSAGAPDALARPVAEVGALGWRSIGRGHDSSVRCGPRADILPEERLHVRRGRTTATRRGRPRCIRRCRRGDADRVMRLVQRSTSACVPRRVRSSRVDQPCTVGTTARAEGRHSTREVDSIHDRHDDPAPERRRRRGRSCSGPPASASSCPR